MGLPAFISVNPEVIQFMLMQQIHVAPAQLRITIILMYINRNRQLIKTLKGIKQGLISKGSLKTF